MPKSIIHLLSGGLDSVTMLYDLKAQGHSVHCLLFHYKQSHVKELDFAVYHANRLGVLWTMVELPPLGGLTKENWIVPNRNAIFLSLAVNYAIKAKADTVTIGCNKDDADYFPDCRNRFLDAMNAAVIAAEYSVEICAPYLNRPKWWIVGMAQDMRIPMRQLWTCYHGSEKPCGECPACRKLQEAIDRDQFNAQVEHAADE